MSDYLVLGMLVDKLRVVRWLWWMVFAIFRNVGSFLWFCPGILSSSEFEVVFFIKSIASCWHWWHHFSRCTLCICAGFNSFHKKGRCINQYPKCILCLRARVLLAHRVKLITCVLVHFCLSVIFCNFIISAGSCGSHIYHSIIIAPWFRSDAVPFLPLPLVPFSGFP